MGNPIGKSHAFLSPSGKNEAKGGKLIPDLSEIQCSS